ncbi:MAG: hypothetical protein GY869_14520, partial [Planctomycetes bacterium]|nr:hypothetical protein [Planctomycetota bacterium]
TETDQVIEPSDLVQNIQISPPKQTETADSESVDTPVDTSPSETETQDSPQPDDSDDSENATEDTEKPDI